MQTAIARGVNVWHALMAGIAVVLILALMTGGVLVLRILLRPAYYPPPR